MNGRDFFWLLIGLAAVALAARATGPRVIVIPDNEPAQAELLGYWKGTRQ